jgi:hypothetical protein
VFIGSKSNFRFNGSVKKRAIIVLSHASTDLNSHSFLIEISPVARKRHYSKNTRLIVYILYGIVENSTSCSVLPTF